MSQSTKRISWSTAVLIFVVTLAMIAQQPSPLWEPITPSTGTTYTVKATDCGTFLTFNNASAVAVTLPQSTSSFFPPGCWVEVQNYGAGTVTITPTTSTIANGGTNYGLAQNQGTKIVADTSNNYQVQPGKGSTGVTSVGLVGTANQVTVTGTSPITSTGSWTLAIPSVFTAPGSIAPTTTFINNVNTVSSGASPNFDLSLGNIQTITALGTNATATFSNVAAGKIYVFFICQDATGGRTFTWPATAKGAMAISGTASSCSAQSFYSNGTNLYAYAPGIVGM